MAINPGVAVISALFFSLIVSFTKPFLVALAPIFFLFFTQEISLKKFLKKLLILNIFVVVIAITVYLEADFQKALTIFLRVNLILIFNLILFSKSYGYDIVRGFHLLRFPKKFVATIHFAVKMNNELFLELKKIRNTLRLRSFTPKTSLFTYQSFGNILGMLFVRSIKRAETLSQTLFLRGFNNEIFLLCNTQTARNDYILMLLILLTFLERML